jgi:hypothetical protein
MSQKWKSLDVDLRRFGRSESMLQNGGDGLFGVLASEPIANVSACAE